MDVGRIGVWAAQLRSRDLKKIADVAATVEELGFSAAWVPGGAGGEVFAAVDSALGATTRLTVATGILNIWMHSVEETARWHAGVRERHPGRMLLGLGASHASLVESVGQEYRKPLTALRTFLDGLDAAEPPVPADQRVLAALGPRMLELAATRSRGAHPYLTDPAHTRVARETMGPAALLAPELKVVLDMDASRARQVARAHLEPYLKLPNYTRNLLRTGYTEADLAGGGSDRLIDGAVAWGASRRSSIEPGRTGTQAPTTCASRSWRRIAATSRSRHGPSRARPARGLARHRGSMTIGAWSHRWPSRRRAIPVEYQPPDLVCPRSMGTEIRSTKRCDDRNAPAHAGVLTQPSRCRLDVAR